MGNYQPAGGGAVPTDPTFNSVTTATLLATGSSQINGDLTVFGTTTQFTGGVALGDSSTDVIGFYGTTPRARPNIAPAATDLATVITLANSIRDGLRNAASGVGLMG